MRGAGDALHPGGGGQEQEEAEEGGDRGGRPEAEAGHHSEQEYRAVQQRDPATQVTSVMSCERSEGSETLRFRYIELTEEDKEKLKGSYKVAKKLEKLESRDKNGDSEEDDDYDCDPGEYPSLDSFTSNVSDPSPASPETSLSPRPTSSPRSGPSPGITNTGNYRQSENIEIMHHDNTQSHSWFQQITHQHHRNR